MKDDETVAKTLWSETLIDALLFALEKKSPDDKVKELIKDIIAKGYKPDYILNKVTKEQGEVSARRVKMLLGK